MLEKKIVMSLGMSALGILASSTTSFADEKEAFVTASALNVRSEASINSSVITKVYKGEIVKITESSNGWYKIRTSNGVVGWSSTNYLKINNDIKNLEDKVDKTNQQETTTTNNKTGVITASALNLRSGAGTNHTVIARLKRNENVSIIESINGWYKVKASNGQIGWSSSKYISIKNSGQNISNTTQENVNNNKNEIKEENINLINKDGVVTANLLNVRSGIGTSNSIITKLKKGDTIKVIEDSNGWYKIKTSSGTIGWSSSIYIDLIGNTNSQIDQEVEKIEEIKEEIPKVESSLESDSENVKKIIDLAMKQIGKPYLWGSEGPDSFDCSGLVYYVFKEAIDMKLPRTSKDQYKVGIEVSRSELQAGDLVFSSTRSDRVITHVGIYIGDGKMIHSPNSGKNVEISDLSNNYWQNSYVGGKRVL